MRQFIKAYFFFLFFIFSNAICFSENLPSVKDTGTVKALLKFCDQLINKVKFDSCLTIANQAKHISEEIKFKEGAINSQIIIGLAYKEKGNYDSAFYFLNKSLTEAEDQKNRKSIFYSNASLARLFIRMKKYDEAIQYLDNAFKTDLTKSEMDSAFILTDYGTIYVAKQKYNLALDVLLKASAIYSKNNKEISNASIYGNIGRILFEQGKHKEALEYFKKVEIIGDKYGLKLILKRTYASISLLYLEAFKTKNTKNGFSISNTKDYIDKLYNLANEMNDGNAKCIAYERYSQYYEMQNEPKKALQNLREYMQLNDSLTALENNTAIMELSIKYDAEKKEDKIKLLEQENAQKEFVAETKGKTQKLTVIFLILFFIALVIIFYVGFKNYKNKQAYKLEKIEKERIKTEIIVFKNQISPHTTFNTLNTIFFQIDEDPEVAKEMTAKFAELLRYQLYECDVELIEIEKEIEYLFKFIEMQKLRASNRCRIEFSVDKAAKDFKVAPLILIPLIENAFKHTTNDKDRDNFIIASLEMTDKKLVFNCRNTAYEIKQESIAGGIGLSNLKNRLQLIYANDHELLIANNNAEFNVKLTINVA